MQVQEENKSRKVIKKINYNKMEENNEILCRKEDVEIRDSKLEYISLHSAISSFDGADKIFNESATSIINGGDLIFAYKNSKYNGLNNELVQVSVVKTRKYNLETYEYEKDFIYSIYMVTENWTTILPNISLDYLENELYDDLEKFKVDKNILAAYKFSIQDLKQTQEENKD